MTASSGDSQSADLIEKVSQDYEIQNPNHGPTLKKETFRKIIQHPQCHANLLPFQGTAGFPNEDGNGKVLPKDGGGNGNRLRIRHAVSGSILCVPGPAPAKNGWSLPEWTFQVGDLVGSIVLKVKDGAALKDEQLMVSAVLTAEDEVAPNSFSLKEVSQFGWVAVA